MSRPAIADKPFALIEARIDACVTLMVNGSCGGQTPEESFIRYRVQVALYTELTRLREALEEAFTDDDEKENA